MEKVNVSKGALVSLVAVALGALLGVAFLLGKVSVSAPPSGPPVERPRPASAPVPPGPAARPAESTPSAQTPVEPAAPSQAGLPSQFPVAPSAPDRSSVPQAVPVAVPPPAPVAAADPVAPAVAAYLDAVDRIQPGSMSGDAESMAQEMAGALAKGDTSGLDRLIQQTEAAKQRLLALSPPAPCAAYHRESLASLDDGIGMLRSLRRALDSAEPAAELASVASRGNDLRTRAEALRTEGDALRQRYGIRR